MEELNAAYLWGLGMLAVAGLLAWVVTRPAIVFLRASFGSSQEALDSLELALFKARKGVEKRKNWIDGFKARRNERWAEKAVKAWGESQAKALARKLVEKDAAVQREAEVEAKAWIKSHRSYGKAVSAALVEEIALLKEELEWERRIAGWFEEEVVELEARLEKAEDLNSRNAVRSVDLVRAEQAKAQAKHREQPEVVECAEIWGGGSCPNPSTCKHYH